MKRLDPFAVPLDGTHLIEANAGTGKTYTIATLYVRLLLERALPVDQILVVTYTHAATAELRRTVRERVAGALSALRGEGDPTDDALRELIARRRAGADVGGDCGRLEAALFGFDCAAIHTIHGFAQRVLQEHAFESGVPFDAEMVGDERLLIDEIVRDFWTRERYDAPPELVRYLAERRVKMARLAQLARLAAAHPALRIIPERPEIDLPAALAAGVDVEAALERRLRQLEIDVTTYTRAELRHRKQVDEVLSFDDLLQRLAGALAGDSPHAAELATLIRTRFPAALVDEFQDTDPIQYAIFSAVYGGGTGALFLIGDPKQAIYGFRGADVFAYLRARQAASDAVYTLDVNRRSGPALVRAVNTLFGRVHAPFVFADLPFVASDTPPDAVDALAGAAAGRAPLRIVFVPRTGRPCNRRTGRMNSGADALSWLYAAVADAVVELLEAPTAIGTQQIAPGDVAVLCRTNRQTAAMQAALRRVGVPTVMQSEASVFDTPEAVAVERVVRALADPGDAAALTAALITPIVGLTGDAVFAARRDGREWDAWVERFQSWHEAWIGIGFTAAFRRLLDGCDAPKRLLAQTGGERSLTNILHLGELLEAAAAEARRGPLGLVEWLQRMRGDSGARAGEWAESAQIRLESDARALRLVTVHKSKGLQYPVVICPFLWDGRLRHPQEFYARFHAGDAADRLTVDLDGDGCATSRASADREAFAENMRLLYVALTRAQQLCLVVWGQFTDCETSALGLLLHPPANATAADPVAALKGHVSSLSDDAMRGDLRRLAEESNGAIEVVELSAASPPSFRRRGEDGPRPSVRRMSREIRQRWRMTSFSALTADEHRLPEPAVDGLDRDEPAQPTDPVEPVAPVAVRGFPRGRSLGTLVHKIFETIDFAERDAALLRAHTRALVPHYGIEPQWAEPLADAVSDVLDTPLTAEEPLTLRDVATSRRLNELEFVCPVALGASETPAGALTAARVADTLILHGAPWLAEYAERARQLPFGPLSGYLKGYIDLVFEHGGRWFIVDYKTNDLGAHADHYRRAALLADMQRHHYVLQYHLYAVAVHRYLEQRLTGYDCARHFGGVLYLYVRGMAPSHERGCGVFFDRPAGALIRALSDLLRPSPAAEERA